MDRLVKSEANAQRIAAVENCFGGSGQSLAIPGRVLIGEGVLTKMCRKKPKPRQFFLFNDILVYGNIVMNKKKYNKQHIIPLEEVKLEDLEDDGALKNGWLLRTLTKSFAVYAATAKEKAEWIAHISKCVDNLLQITGKKPTTEHAAVWVPDAEASICMHCRRTQFTLINRRHHCRKCGAVVCGSCSSKKFLLPTQSSKSLRVCLSCYDKLSKARCPISNEMAKAAISQNQNKPVTYDSSGDEDSDEDEQLESDQEICGVHYNVSLSVLKALGMEEKPIFYENGDEENSVMCDDKVPNKTFTANIVAANGPSESSVAEY